LAEFCRTTGAEKATADNVVDHYAASATEEILAGFFARKVVLVEGPTEALALPIYLSRLGAAPAKEGIGFVPVHGVSNLARWWRLFSAYGIPTMVIFDNDSRDDADGGKRVELLTAIGVSDAEASRVITSQDWVVEPRFAVCGLEFEAVLRRDLPGYEELERQARGEFGLSSGGGKPLVARFVAERVGLDADAVNPRGLPALSKAITELR
jgi:putative ATP-dependent endonuclease of OLD family